MDHGRKEEKSYSYKFYFHNSSNVNRTPSLTSRYALLLGSNVVLTDENVMSTWGKT